MIELGYINQNGIPQSSDREYSPYHDLLEYILSEWNAPLESHRHGDHPPVSPEQIAGLPKDRSIAGLLSREEKRELYAYLRFAYASQVLHILQSENPKEFLFHAAEVIRTIRTSQASPLPAANKNHRNYVPSTKENTSEDTETT